MQIIAEIKTKSPFGYVSKLSWMEQFALAAKIGNIISVHTDERWGGSFGNLCRVKAELEERGLKTPILAKGFHSDGWDVEAAFTCGANYVLVIRDDIVEWVKKLNPIYYPRVWIEPKNFQQLEALASDNANYHIVWNSRDLTTGLPKKETFEDARRIYKGWLCQASNIRGEMDIYYDCNPDAVLIGEHLQSFAE